MGECVRSWAAFVMGPYPSTLKRQIRHRPDSTGRKLDVRLAACQRISATSMSHRQPPSAASRRLLERRCSFRLDRAEIKGKLNFLSLCTKNNIPFSFTCPFRPHLSSSSKAPKVGTMAILGRPIVCHVGARWGLLDCGRTSLTR